MYSDSVARKQQEVTYHEKKISHLNELWYEAHERFIHARRSNNLAKRALVLEEMLITSSIQRAHTQRITELTTEGMTTTTADPVHTSVETPRLR